LYGSRNEEGIVCSDPDKATAIVSMIRAAAENENSNIGSVDCNGREWGADNNAGCRYGASECNGPGSGVELVIDKDFCT
jgi:hypothetical protein